MWLDIMSQYNTLQVNIKLANLLGLEVATYWAALMDVYARVVNKFKDELKTFFSLRLRMGFWYWYISDARENI